MIDDEAIGAVIAGCEAALEQGSDDVRAAARVLLLALGHQIAEQAERGLDGSVIALRPFYEH